MTTPRVYRARIAALTRWAKTTDRRAATEPARRAWLAKFVAQVSSQIVDPVERERRGRLLLRGHMLRLRAKGRTAGGSSARQGGAAPAPAAQP